MDGMLSQEEINALLGNVDADSTSEEADIKRYFESREADSGRIGCVR